jgi:hypothetical protein
VYATLVRQGFKAVPALIEALEDERMTRRVRHGFDNFRPWQMRVQHVVSDILKDIAGKDVGVDWLRALQGYAVKTADARAWWERARKLGEEAHLLAGVFPKEGENVNEVFLELIAARYPRQLPTLYRTLLDKHPAMQGWALAKAVAKGPFPRKQKLELLRAGASRRSLMRRSEALTQIKDLDRTLFTAIVMQTLKELPVKPKEPYWGCQEACFAEFVQETDEEKVWGLLEKVARRSSIGLRMELLNNATAAKSPLPALRRRQLALLARFLDDAAVRDADSDPKMFEGPYAGDGYPRLAVRDFAAMGMAHLLKIDVPLKPQRSAAEWARLRQQVRKAWEQDRARKEDKR